MDADRRRRIEELVHAARAPPAAARAGFLAQACGSDATLHSGVESLLSKADASDWPTEAPASNWLREAFESGAFPPASRSLAGRRIGTYQLLALIGVGGMGEVRAWRSPMKYQ